MSQSLHVVYPFILQSSIIILSLSLLLLAQDRTDATGLTAKYDFTLTYESLEPLPAPATIPADLDPVPDIFAAPQSQLGPNWRASRYQWRYSSSTTWRENSQWELASQSGAVSQRVLRDPCAALMISPFTVTPQTDGAKAL